MRDSFARWVTLAGVAVVAITELLGAFTMLRRPGLVVCWLLLFVACGAVIIRRNRGTMQRFRPWRIDWVALLCGLGITAVVVLTGVTAAWSPPNSADAMAYHMPRVVYWAEQASVRFFPTPYLNQIMLQPFAEYCMLHAYLLTGGDGLTNFVQWFASLVSVLGVSLIAKEWDSGVRGQAVAALFCATLPAGILASSGAKNDYVLAMWLVLAVYFTLCFTAGLRWRDAAFAGAAVGLALLTKATAYLFVPPVLAAIVLARAGKENTRRILTGAMLAAGIAVWLNLPQYARNMTLSGSILGFDSAQGDGLFRWRNESFGWRQTLSNVLRNTSEQLGSRSNQWNEAVYRAVVAIHRRLGIDVNDPATTWRWSEFHPPRNANHEADAPNPVHLAILAAVFCMVFWRGKSARNREQAFFAAGLGLAFVAFCAYLKWQPFLGRLFVPLFVLGAPLAGEIAEFGDRWKRSGARFVTVVCVLAGACLLMMDQARHPLFDNWVRPLRGPNSILRRPRADQYFADMGQWANSGTYRKAVSLLAGLHCETVGIDITNLQLEYPLQALLRARRPEVEFVHTGVNNASARYRPSLGAIPCAVACLDCAGDLKRMLLYRTLEHSAVVDRFIVFW